MNALAEQTVIETQAQADEVMLRYKETHDVELRNRLVIYYSYIARTVAAQMYGLTSNYAQIEDIVNEGIIAIINCLEKFDPGRGVIFKSFAFRRVQGTIIDFVRKQDWFPRRVRVNARNIVEAYNQLCNELLREPTESEFAQRLGMTLEEYRKSSYEAANALIFSFEGVIENMTCSESPKDLFDYDGDQPENSLDRKELHAKLTEAIESLSERERLVVTLYYFEHMKLSGISKIMGVSDQRVSQICSKAILKIRKIMTAYIQGE